MIKYQMNFAYILRSLIDSKFGLATYTGFNRWIHKNTRAMKPLDLKYKEEQLEKRENAKKRRRVLTSRKRLIRW